MNKLFERSFTKINGVQTLDMDSFPSRTWQLLRSVMPYFCNHSFQKHFTTFKASYKTYFAEIAAWTEVIKPNNEWKWQMNSKRKRWNRQQETNKLTWNFKEKCFWLISSQIHCFTCIKSCICHIDSRQSQLPIVNYDPVGLKPLNRGARTTTCVTCYC